MFKNNHDVYMRMRKNFKMTIHRYEGHINLVGLGNLEKYHVERQKDTLKNHIISKVGTRIGQITFRTNQVEDF